MEAPRETTNLVKHYFNICNTALSQRHELSVTSAVLALLDELASGETVTLRVEREGKTACHYTTRFIDGAFTPILEGEHEPSSRFSLSEAYLHEVADNADDFIAHPERLDWSWIAPGA